MIKSMAELHPGLCGVSAERHQKARCRLPPVARHIERVESGFRELSATTLTVAEIRSDTVSGIASSSSHSPRARVDCPKTLIASGSALIRIDFAPDTTRPIMQFPICGREELHRPPAPPHRAMGCWAALLLPSLRLVDLEVIWMARPIIRLRPGSKEREISKRAALLVQLIFVCLLKRLRAEPKHPHRCTIKPIYRALIAASQPQSRCFRRENAIRNLMFPLRRRALSRVSASDRLTASPASVLRHARSPSAHGAPT